MEKETNENENVLFQKYAIEDLQKFMVTAGSSTTEKELTSWQLGYIAGVNRAMGIRNG